MLRGSQPAHVRVLEKLRGAIDSGKLAAGAFVPAERDIAAEYGVSRPTVRRALEELERSGSIVRGDGKRPRVAQRTAPSATVKTHRDHVAMFSAVPFSAVVQGENSDLTNIVASVVQGFEPLGVNVTYMNTYGVELETEAQMSELIEPFYAGVVFLANAVPSDGALRALAHAACPSVVVSGYVEPVGGRVHTVDRDDVAGGMLATGHLLEHGHRGIVHATYDQSDPWIERRICGYRRAMRETKGARATVIAPFTFQMADKDERAAALARQMPDDVEAVFAVNDAMAEVVFHWAESTGRRIPEDLSLVGFDNVEVAVERSLTSVSHMSAELGRTAMEILAEAMGADAPRIVRRAVVDPILVTRTSVARRTKRTSGRRKKT